MSNDRVVNSKGDRADVVENVKLNESVNHVLHYARDIANNDAGDVEAQHCVKVLESLLANSASAIDDAIE